MLQSDVALNIPTWQQTFPCKSHWFKQLTALFHVNTLVCLSFPLFSHLGPSVKILIISPSCFYLFIYLFACTRSYCSTQVLCCGMRGVSLWYVGPSSLTRDLTWAPCIGSAESYPCLSFISYFSLYNFIVRLPWWLSGKESACQCKRLKRSRFNPWVGKIPWKRKWQPTSVFLSGKSHG